MGTFCKHSAAPPRRTTPSPDRQTQTGTTSQSWRTWSLKSPVSTAMPGVLRVCTRVRSIAEARRSERHPPGAVLFSLPFTVLRQLSNCTLKHWTKRWMVIRAQIRVNTHAITRARLHFARLIRLGLANRPHACPEACSCKDPSLTCHPTSTGAQG